MSQPAIPQTPPSATATATPPAPVDESQADGRIAAFSGFAFYAWVSSLALVGSVIASGHWLQWDVIFRIPLCIALELGSIALAARADFRRIKGEKAYGYLTLSALFCAVALAVNLFGHDYFIAGVVFACLSGAAYIIWLLNSGDRRRDARRGAGDMDALPPDYGIVRKLRHPILISEATQLAKADPTLGLHGSIAKAIQNRKDEAADKAIEAWLRGYYTQKLGAQMAALLIVTLPLREMARYIREHADAHSLARLVLDQLEPDRVEAAVRAADREVSRSERRALPAVASDQTGRGDQATRLRAVAATSIRPSRATIQGVVGSSHQTTDRGDQTGPTTIGPQAVKDAAEARLTFPDGLPDPGGHKALKETFGWGQQKATNALAAYRAGADLTALPPADEAVS